MSSFDVKQGGVNSRPDSRGVLERGADRWTWLQLMCCAPWIIWSWISKWESKAGGTRGGLELYRVVDCEIYFSIFFSYLLLF